jgi:hypothetical protein
METHSGFVNYETAFNVAYRFKPFIFEKRGYTKHLLQVNLRHKKITLNIYEVPVREMINKSVLFHPVSSALISKTCRE